MLTSAMIADIVWAGGYRVSEVPAYCNVGESNVSGRVRSRASLGLQSSGLFWFWQAHGTCRRTLHCGATGFFVSASDGER
jgi:hypothetical protein